jgi:predicted DCC family thiol-disulfide oxidoreductase YuxK
MPKGTLIYDGDCGFCGFWIRRWRAWTDGSVEAIAAREAAERFPEITEEELDRAVQYVRADGRTVSAAEAVFRSLADGGGARLPLALYERFPVFAAISERGYAFVAARRPLFSRITRALWGDDPTPPTYRLAARAFTVCLSAIYFCAFASLAVQIAGLAGPRGILPVSSFWAGTSEGALRGACWLGAALALSAPFARAWAPVPLGAAWLLYFSLYRAGGLFLGYQWDVLLLETGFLALFVSGTAPPPRGGVWAVRWLLFRLMLLSGAVKLLSGDRTWWDLTALTFHYETQPLPTRLAWYAHHLPEWFQRASVAAVYLIEFVLPFFVFGPGRLRIAAGLGFIFLMGLIGAAGNYNFFNALTVCLCLFLFDDAWLRRRFGRLGGREHADAGTLRRRAAWALALFVGVSGAAQMALRFVPAARSGAFTAALAAAGRRFHLVNSYGLFAVMTTVRNEIVLEGSADGAEWKAYEFRWKPGDPNRAPGWAQPHQPRLDWQMWFAALAPYRNNPWYFQFQKRILEGSPPVLGLLETNPFPEKPPRLLRSLFYEYRFSDPGSREAWWTRELKGLYAPMTALNEEGELILLMPGR